MDPRQVRLPPGPIDLRGGGPYNRRSKASSLNASTATQVSPVAGLSNTYNPVPMASDAVWADNEGSGYTHVSFRGNRRDPVMRAAGAIALAA